MKEATIYGMYQNLARYVQQVEQSARLGITGEAVRNAAFQALLIKKGLITEAEMTEAIGEIIKKANEPQSQETAQTEEAPKVELTTPTPEQVVAIEKSVVEEPKANG